jgi:hypothetical protein
MNGSSWVLSQDKGNKAKTSINIDKQVWKEWIQFVVAKTGSARKVSEELEKALQEYMKKHR